MTLTVMTYRVASRVSRALQELFRPFGPVSRIFLAVDKNTGENRGFAFVNYVHRCVLVRVLP